MQRLRSRELEKPTDESLDGDTAHIKLNSVEMDNGRSAGSERLALGALDALGLPGVLKDVGFSDRDARIAVELVVARMIHPSSEREALRWLDLHRPSNRPILTSIFDKTYFNQYVEEISGAICESPYGCKFRLG